MTASRLGVVLPGLIDLDGIVAKSGRSKIAHQQPAIGMGVGAHPAVRLRRKRRDLRHQRARPRRTVLPGR